VLTADLNMPAARASTAYLPLLERALTTASWWGAYHCDEPAADSSKALLLTAYHCFRHCVVADGSVAACRAATAGAYALLDHIRLGHPGGWRQTLAAACTQACMQRRQARLHLFLTLVLATC
jgi:hypothetical protein